MKKIEVGTRVTIKSSSYGELKGTYIGDEQLPIGTYHIVITDDGQKVLTTRMEVAP